MLSAAVSPVHPNNRGLRAKSVGADAGTEQPGGRGGRHGPWAGGDDTAGRKQRQRRDFVDARLCRDSFVPQYNAEPSKRQSAGWTVFRPACTRLRHTQAALFPAGGLQRVFSIGRCYSLSSLPRPCPRFRLAGGWGLAGTLTAGVCCWRRNPACMPACGFTRAFSQCIFRTAQGAPGPGKPRPDHQRIVARRREHVW